ncbi:LamG-like jellyroll fold domain-containing protein [Planctomycetota bacterium]
MAQKEKVNEKLVCPKTGRPINSGKYRWIRWILPLTGLVSLAWFLVRVIPKPSRATYPCQRMAAPLASGFVVWLLGIVGSSLAYHRARRLLSQSRYLMAGICASLAVTAIWWSLSMSNSDPASAAFIPTEPPNNPIGIAKGIHPGRVVWIREPDATSWDSSTGRWWDDDNTNQKIVDYMAHKSIRALTGESDDIQAWDALFRHFNQINGFGDVSYQYGEKIAIKINMNQDAGAPISPGWNPRAGMPSPHVVYALLDQLINKAGVPGSAITVYDASRYIGDPIYDKVRSNPDQNFQSVAFVVAPVTARDGRIAAQLDQDNPVYTKGGITYLPQCVTKAKYLINMALLRPHQFFGVTLCAKNHFGSVRYPDGLMQTNWTSLPLHNYGMRGNPMGSYNCLVELNGHRHLAKKTLLYFLDALYPATHQHGNVMKFASFDDDWFSSMLVSQDPVAIDSVGLDFLRNEPRCTEVTGYPDNYLHEMALADNPPSGTFYDPERDGTGLTSLGVHEHWNNAVDKMYSRNLGTGQGIEFVVASLDPVVDFNNDEIVDSLDMSMMVDHWGTDEPLYDIAPPPLGDGVVDVQDLILLSEYLFEEIFPPELVAYWKLDEAEDFVAYDSAGANDAVLIGGAVWQPSGGKLNGALQLDGIDGYAVTGQILNPANGPFSVFTWVNGGAPGQVILSQVNGANWLMADHDFGCVMTELIPPAVGRFLPQPLISEYVITDGQWHRIGYVWDGENRSLYVDDILVAEDTQVNLQGSDGSLYIGVNKNLDAGTYFSGLIDDVRIYNRALRP